MVDCENSFTVMFNNITTTTNNIIIIICSEKLFEVYFNDVRLLKYN